MTTKHEGKCCGFCNHIELGKPFTCKNPACPCHAEPTGAGMREYQEWCYSVLRLDKDDLIVSNTFNHWNDKLSRLHSRIVEEVEKEKYLEVGLNSLSVIHKQFHNKGIDKAIKRINQAFKDL